MTQQTDRPLELFRGTPIDMLTTCGILIRRVRKHQAEIVLTNTTITPELLDEVEEELADAHDTYVGLDVSKELRGATMSVHFHMATAKKLVKNMHTLIQVQFADNPDLQKEILRQNGFNAHYKRAVSGKGKQESMVALLGAMKQNLNPGYKIQIIGKGMPAANVDTLISMAPDLHTANLSQEEEKQNRTELTDEKTNRYNAVHKRVAGICKIAVDAFAGQPRIQSEFRYQPTLERLQSGLITPKELGEDNEIDPQSN